MRRVDRLKAPLPERYKKVDTSINGNLHAAYIRGKRGGMKLVSMGDGLENVSSKI